MTGGTSSITMIGTADRVSTSAQTMLVGAMVPYVSRSLTGMAEIVLRVRLINGDRLDVTYSETDTADADEVAEHVIAALGVDSGMIRARHGDRVLVVYGRGVAAVELAPRGAVL